jgi:CBS domain-containing protein
MDIEQRMKRHLLTCTPNETLDVASCLLADDDLGVIAVVGEAGQLIGIVTHHDISLAAGAWKHPIHALPIGLVMTMEVVSCRVDEPLEVALQRMRSQHLRRMPVVDADGRPLGVLLAGASGRDERAPAAPRTAPQPVPRGHARSTADSHWCA